MRMHYAPGFVAASAASNAAQSLPTVSLRIYAVCVCGGGGMNSLCTNRQASEKKVIRRRLRRLLATAAATRAFF